jgi:hypothetical protein
LKPVIVALMVILMISIAVTSFVIGRVTMQSTASTETIGSQTIITTTQYGWFAQINYTVQGQNLTTITCTLLPADIQAQYWQKSLAMVASGNPLVSGLLSVLINKLPVYGCH